MTPRTDLEPRVDDLEKKVAKLESTTERLKRGQAETRRIVKDLAAKVDGVLPGVDQRLAAQTGEINDHVDQRLAEHRQFVLSTVIDVARQWPAPSLVAVTAVLALVVAVAAVWILNFTGHLHFA